MFHPDIKINIIIFILVLVIGAVFWQIFRTLIMRFFLGMRFGRGRRGERIARKFLIRHGFAILAEQLSQKAYIIINGKKHEYEVRADFLVKKGRCRGIVEVKTGDTASNPLSIQTRRQLFEYYHLFDVDILYFFNAGNRTLREIEFRTRG